MRHRSLDRRANGTDLVIVFVLTQVELAVSRLLRRRDVARPLESLVCDDCPGKFENFLHLALQLLHVMVTSGSWVRDEDYVSGFVADNEASVARGLVFAGPHLGCGLPRPARPQRAVYQRHPAAGHLLRLLGIWPEFLSCLGGERGEFCDYLGDGGLGDAEEVGDDFLDHILPFVQQRDHDRFPQRQAFRPPDSLIPRFSEESFDALLKLIELFSVQPEGTMVTQRLLRRLMVWFAPPSYRFWEPLPFRRAAPEL